MTKKFECIYLNTSPESRCDRQEKRYTKTCGDVPNSKVKGSPAKLKMKNTVYFKKFNIQVVDQQKG